MQDYVCAYEMNAPKDTIFNTHGLCILNPTICEITEELNGTYSLYIEHPIDELGKWKSISNHNIIKAGGQLFRVVRRKVKMNSSGQKVVSADCPHIFYDFNHRYMRNMVVYDTAHWMLEHIMTDWQADEPDPRFYEFEHRIDVNAVATTEYRDTTVTAALMGTGSNSLTTLFGAQIHRDNFYFSILPRKEHARDNAFSIQYGIDMIDVEQVVDWTNFCSKFHAEDNFGNPYDNRWSGLAIPHEFNKRVTFSYSENIPPRLGRDAENYFESIMYPKVSYKVNYADLKNSKLYAEFDTLKTCNVGDRGFIFCDEIGIRVDSTDPAQQVQVVRKVTDVIGGNTTAIELGSLTSSFVRQTSFSDITVAAVPTRNDAIFTITDREVTE